MNWPNRLTLTRLFSVPFLIIAIYYCPVDQAFLRHLPLVLFSAASLLDAIDGYIARRYRQQTELGAFLDPLADKTLILTTFITLYMSPAYVVKMPIWALIIIASRDAIIVMWLIVSYMNHMEIRIRPNVLGKLTTVCQMVTIIFIMLSAPFVAYAWSVTAVLTVLSAISYIFRESKQLKARTIDA